MLPPCVGSEPTITQPLRNATRAVVRPTPPGQALPRLPTLAKSDSVPCGVTWTIVVPVPCTFAWSLKLLTRTLPRFWSPLPGLVDVSSVTVFSGPMNVVPALAAPARIPVPASSPPATVTTAARPAACRRVAFIPVPLPPGGCLHPWARFRERDGSVRTDHCRDRSRGHGSPGPPVSGPGELLTAPARRPSPWSTCRRHRGFGAGAPRNEAVIPGRAGSPRPGHPGSRATTTSRKHTRWQP